LPFCVYGGPIADDRDVAAALEHRARELALNLNVDTFEVRYRQPPEQTNEANSPVYQSNLYYTFRKQIELGAIPPKRASEIRKAYSYGLNVKFNDDIESFLPAFDTLMRNHGTPAFPRKYFHVLREVFGNNCEIMTIREKNGRIICAGMSFYFRNEVLPYSGGGPKEGRARHATALMDFELMKHASEVRGAEIFDFGRSKKVDPKTGPFFYKCHWGFNPQPLAYEYHLINATKLPEINPTNPKFSALIAAWKRLPLWLARGIGPHISPFVG
jgi:FemAB-related protein (PEP-CTERM system-associated)